MVALPLRRSLASEAGSGDPGEFHDSTPDVRRPEALRQRLREDGYLFLRGVVDASLLGSLRTLAEAELRRGPEPRAESYRVLEQLGTHPAALGITRDPELLRIFSSLLARDAKSMDFVWVRACGKGARSDVHCDWVYMSRGSRNILSAWIPLMDVSREQGPLMILERSHREKEAALKKYLEMDADRLGLLNGLRWKHGELIRGGRYSRKPDRVAADLGCRWLTADFSAGDIAIFATTCLHATLPNKTEQWRLSIDARFQPSCEQVDPRFSGPQPETHSRRDKNLLDLVRNVTAGLTSFTR